MPSSSQQSPWRCSPCPPRHSIVRSVNTCLCTSKNHLRWVFFQSFLDFLVVMGASDRWREGRWSNPNLEISWCTFSYAIDKKSVPRIVIAPYSMLLPSARAWVSLMALLTSQQFVLVSSLFPFVPIVSNHLSLCTGWSYQVDWLDGFMGALPVVMYGGSCKISRVCFRCFYSNLNWNSLTKLRYDSTPHSFICILLHLWKVAYCDATPTVLHTFSLSRRCLRSLINRPLHWIQLHRLKTMRQSGFRLRLIQHPGSSPGEYN